MGARTRGQGLGEGGKGQDLLKLPKSICCVTALSEVELEFSYWIRNCPIGSALSTKSFEFF